MILNTPVACPKSSLRISYQSRLMFVGSCFAENVSAFFQNAKFRCLVNPSGIIYNPLSLRRLFDSISNGKTFTADDFFVGGDQYCCYDFHGSFSRPDINEAVSLANASTSGAASYLSSCDVLFITLGTAFVYFLASDESVPVSNCHKQPADIFSRRLVDVSEVADNLTAIVETAIRFNPKIRIVFTVSPIRHLKDGAHGNRLSKSTLFLGVDRVVAHYPICEYFPSYEILEDELRDYRFYAEDMAHPSEIAERIIWERIQDSYFDDSVRNDIKRVEKFMNSVHHRIQNPESLNTQAFCQKNLSLAFELEEKIQGLDLSDEKKYFKSYINVC